jgi:hypothetical protein
VPATPAPDIAFSQISVGRAHACGIDAGGNVTCWGEDLFGETRAPHDLYTQISAGDDLTCGLRRDGTVDCWGDNVYGQLIVPHNVPNAAIYLANTYQSYKRNLVQIMIKGTSTDARETGLIIRTDSHFTYVLTAGRLLRGVDSKRVIVREPLRGVLYTAQALSLTPGVHTNAMLAIIAIPAQVGYATVPWGNSYRLVQDPTVFSFYLTAQPAVQPQHAPLTITAVGADRHDSLGSFWITYGNAPTRPQPGDALIRPDGTLVGITIAAQSSDTAIAVQSNWARPVVDAQIAALKQKIES